MFATGVRQLACIASIALLAIACRRGGGTRSSAPSSSAAAKSLPPNVDAKLLADLNELVRVCKLDQKEGNLNCPQGEHRRLASEFISQQRDRTKATATFAAALSDKNPALVAVAANVLYSAFRSPWAANLESGSIPARDADALLAATLKLPRPQALQAIPAAVHAEMLANRADALLQSLDKSGEAQLRTTAIRYFMTHGRLQVFPKIQELAKSADLPITLAALESPYHMYEWSPNEQRALCPWAAAFLTDQRPAVVSKASSLLGHCRGEYLDRLLDAGEAAIAAGDFSAGRVGAYRDVCAPHRRARPNAPTDAQCTRARKLLASAVAAKALDEQTRALALSTLAYQWPDEETLKLARKLSADANKSVAANAASTATRLEQRLRVASSGAQHGPSVPSPPEPSLKAGVGARVDAPARARISTGTARPSAPDRTTDPDPDSDPAPTPAPATPGESPD